MTVKSVIFGLANKVPGSQLIPASVVKGRDENALVVATRDLKAFDNKIKFFVNPTHGYNMTVDGSFGGTPEHIHNGIDNVYWTASAIAGTWVFDSTAQAHTGTRSIDATATVNNDVAQIAKGSSIDLSGYAAITGWVYIASWDDKGIKRIDVCGWDTVSDSMVGGTINLKDYIDIGLTDVWQKFAVPLSGMVLVGETIDAIRIEAVDVGAGAPPNYDLDDIRIEENGGGVEFKVEADEGTRLHVNTYSILIVDAYATVLADATMPYLSYDKLLGVAALDLGVLYQRVVSGVVTLSFPFRTLADILMFPGATIADYGSDGTNTFLKILVDLGEPIVLSAEEEDKIMFTVSDDLTGLLRLVVTANCKEERIG